MRLTNRDWIAWSLVMGIVIVVAANLFAQQQQTGASPARDVYKIVVTPDH